ncbi:MAG: hypothetical protein JO040_01160 [Gemmatimonadetes bacterium]|nr:hypothetical protein [Gemmatimonadota bacterium]
MSWEPISRDELEEIVICDLAECSPERQALFRRAAIPLEKWRLSPHGDRGGGFWAVAVHEKNVLWYNDIEHGFNVSCFVRWGEIPEDEYWCNQDRLARALPRLTEET